MENYELILSINLKFLIIGSKMNLYLNDFKEIIYRTKNKNIIFQLLNLIKIIITKF